MAEKQRLLQDEVQTYDVRKYNTWLSSRLSAKEDVRKAFSEAPAPTPSPSAEERLQRLVGALEEWCEKGDQLKKAANYTKELAFCPYARSVRKIIKNNA